MVRNREDPEDTVEEIIEELQELRLRRIAIEGRLRYILGRPDLVQEILDNQDPVSVAQADVPVAIPVRTVRNQRRRTFQEGDLVQVVPSHRRRAGQVGHITSLTPSQAYVQRVDIDESFRIWQANLRRVRP